MKIYWIELCMHLRLKSCTESFACGSTSRGLFENRPNLFLIGTLSCDCPVYELMQPADYSNLVSCCCSTPQTLITPAVVPKWCPFFVIIFWNNFVGLNMCCAPLNAAHLEGSWVWQSFNIHFYKDGTPPATHSKCAPLCASYMMHTGARVIRGHSSI